MRTEGAPAHWFLTIFVESKAQTLLTFLFGFGYGFAVQLVRAEERREPVMACTSAGSSCCSCSARFT